MFKVKIKADSINTAIKSRPRITTMEVTFPRYILAEVNTHRELTRNSASSRAIPFKKMVKMVQQNPFIPMAWMKDHPGMQGVEYFTEQKDIDECYMAWIDGRDDAVANAIKLNEIGVTKQLANRLLEPFMWHTALITATEWENFYALRVEEGADIHLQKIAGMMLDAMNVSTPVELKEDEWHIPYHENINEQELTEALYKVNGEGFLINDKILHQAKIEVATARCARLSYQTLGEEPKIDYIADLKITNNLAKAGHWSCFEHCAQAMSNLDHYSYVRGKVPTNLSDEGIFNYEQFGTGEYATSDQERYGWCGNFKGFVQYRKMFPNERRSDLRLLKK